MLVYCGTVTVHDVLFYICCALIDFDLFLIVEFTLSVWLWCYALCFSTCCLSIFECLCVYYFDCCFEYSFLIVTWVLLVRFTTCYTGLMLYTCVCFGVWFMILLLASDWFTFIYVCLLRVLDFRVCYLCMFAVCCSFVIYFALRLPFGEWCCFLLWKFVVLVCLLACYFAWVWFCLIIGCRLICFAWFVVC